MNIFETADGSAHWPSIITMLGWLIGSMVTGGAYLQRCIITEMRGVGSLKKRRHETVATAGARYY